MFIINCKFLFLTDQHGYHILSDDQAARCGYSVLITDRGDLVFRASFQACHVYIQVQSAKILFITKFYPWAKILTLLWTDGHWLSPSCLVGGTPLWWESTAVSVPAPLHSKGAMEQQRNCLWRKLHGGELYITLSIKKKISKS